MIEEKLLYMHASYLCLFIDLGEKLLSQKASLLSAFLEPIPDCNLKNEVCPGKIESCGNICKLVISSVLVCYIYTTILYKIY